MRAKALLAAATLGNVIAVHAADRSTQIHHRTLEVEGVSVFYRAAGPSQAPTVLLLHGFAASS